MVLLARLRLLVLVTRLRLLVVCRKEVVGIGGWGGRAALVVGGWVVVEESAVSLMLVVLGCVVSVVGVGVVRNC